MNKIFSRIIPGLLFLAACAAAVYFYLQNKELKKDLAFERTPKLSKNGCADPCGSRLKWISLREAVGMIAEYGNNQCANINKGMSLKLRTMGLAPGQSVFNDSRFTVFAMDTIKAFICSIDKMLNYYKPQNADGKPIRNCELGIKFYYAAYPGLSADDNISTTYQGRHTLVMIPAYINSETGKYTEFFPSAINPSNHRPLDLVQLYSLDSARSTRMGKLEMQVLTLTPSDERIGKNHGTLCPPPDNCSSPLLELAGSY